MTQVAEPLQIREVQPEPARRVKIDGRSKKLVEVLEWLQSENKLEQSEHDNMVDRIAEMELARNVLSASIRVRDSIIAKLSDAE